MKDEIRCAIEFREDTDRTGPGRLVGTVLTYGQRAKDRAEVFEKDSLSWPSDGVVLNRQHARGAPIMRVTPEVRGDAIVIDQALPDTTAGRDAASEIRSGLLTGLSVSFQAGPAIVHSGRTSDCGGGTDGGSGRSIRPSYDAPVEVRSRRDGRRRVWL